MRPLAWVLVLAFLATGTLLAADPPEVLHYQGVLRDAAGIPQNGIFAMTFHFFDDPLAGTEILCDSHTVTVSNGLFATTLGEPANVTACMGSGSEAALSRTFAEHTDLYLGVDVGGETLWPRIRVAASGYALNSRLVRGREVVTGGPLDLYVDAGTGDDADDGRTPAKPKATIQAAIDAIPPIVHDDVTVHVADGTYAESVVLADRLLPTGAMITLRGNTTTPSQVVITGSGVRPRGLAVNNVSNVTVEGFEVRNHTSWAVAVIRGGTINLNDLSLADNVLGMLLTRTNVVMDSIAVSGNPATGLLCQSGATCRVSNLTITGASTAAFSSRSSDLTFSGPAQISGVYNGLVAEYGGTIELAQRADIQVTASGSALNALLHGRMLGYNNATLSPSGCFADTYGICRP